ncbi:hypothetical protein [Flavobacterium sp. GCM10023249]|uniref:hypothetical protein n=1 Tax=unclassified Flavobacterium TaxID=196869 RepID=UPI00360F21AE
MKKFLFLFILLSSTSCTLKKQEGIFSFEKPTGWKKITSDSIFEHMKSKHQPIVSRETYINIRHQSNSSLDNPFFTIVKRENKHVSDDAFFDSVQKQVDLYKEFYHPIQFTDEPKIIKIDKMDALYYSFEFQESRNNKIKQHRSKAYIIPNNNFSYEIYMNDEKNRDYQKDFDQLLSSIQFDK